VVKYLKGKDTLVKDLEGDLNVESDCEGDSIGVRLEMPKGKEEEEETRAVLITGSFSAYVYFLVHPHVDGNGEFLQLEISLLLLLHRYDLVCSSQIARYQLSVEIHPRKNRGGGTTSLLAEEHLRSRELGETTINQTSHTRR